MSSSVRCKTTDWICLAHMHHNNFVNSVKKKYTSITWIIDICWLWTFLHRIINRWFVAWLTEHQKSIITVIIVTRKRLHYSECEKLSPSLTSHVSSIIRKNDYASVLGHGKGDAAKELKQQQWQVTFITPSKQQSNTLTSFQFSGSCVKDLLRNGYKSMTCFFLN